MISIAVLRLFSRKTRPISHDERPAGAVGAQGGRGRSTPTDRAAGPVWPARVASCSNEQRPHLALGLPRRLIVQFSSF
jgi:hypothetical protein